MQELHVWLTDDFSVCKETLCFHEKTTLPPGTTNFRTASRQGTGLFCIAGVGHKGNHKFAQPDIRLYGFREPKL